MKSIFKQILKFSAFYLEKQKSFIRKKYIFRQLKLNQNKKATDPIFSEGFDSKFHSLTKSTLPNSDQKTKQLSTKSPGHSVVSFF